MDQKLTVIAIGDQHIMTSNIPDVDIFIERITILVQERKPDFIVLLGDMLDTFEKVNSMCLNKAYELVDNMRKVAKTYILVGNHDYINNTQFLSENHWLNGLKFWHNVIVVDKVIKEEMNNMNFVFCPYVYPGRFFEALRTLDWIEPNLHSIDCIFAHQEFLGCKMGAFNSEIGDVWIESNPYVISGHIHLNQKLGENIYYPGSAIQTAFGATDKHIIPILTFTLTQSVRVEEVNLNLPKKHIIYFDKIENVSTFIIPNKQDTFKLSVSGSLEEYKIFKKTKKYKELIDQKIKILFNPTKRQTNEKNTKLNKMIEDHKDTDFIAILSKLISDTNNEILYDDYKTILN